MKTPMQELHHWVSTELKLDGYEHRVILDKIESMLEKEKEVIMDAFQEGKWDSMAFKGTPNEQYYNETFNNKECYHEGKYTYNKETLKCHKCGLIVPNEYRFNTKEK